MLPRWNTALTPGIRRAAAASIDVTRPLAMVARTGTAYSMPGSETSEV